MREKIWYEMLHTKMGETYLGLYLNRQRVVRKYYSISILIISALGGGLGWKLGTIAPTIACAIIGVMQLIKLIENQIVLSDGELVKIGALRNLFTSYFNELEHLWVEVDSDRLIDSQASEKFYQLRQSAVEIESADNNLFINSMVSLTKRADIQTRDYFKQYHNQKSISQ
jgi:hypothetical protein